MFIRAATAMGSRAWNSKTTGVSMTLILAQG